MSDKILRHGHPSDTAANWKANNPVIGKGEFAIESDTGKFKIGDGVNNYNDIDYSSSNSINNILDGTGTGSLQQNFDGSETLDFTGKNPALTADNVSTYFGDGADISKLPRGGVGNFATSLGGKSIAKGKRSTAEGTTTIAIGAYSHAEGDNSVTLGDDSHAEGYMTTAQGSYSHSEGCNTIAKGNTQHVQGKYNIEDVVNKYAHIVGNGTSDTARSNAHTLDWDGNAWFSGDIKIYGNSYDDTTASTVATQNYVDAHIADKEDSSHKTTSITADSTDIQYPSAKAVYDYVETKVSSGGSSSKILLTTITVPTTGWTTQTDTNSTNYYTIDITNAEILNTMTSGFTITDVALPDDIAAARLQNEAYQCINKAEISTGKVTLYCFDSIPTVACTMKLLISY